MLMLEQLIKARLALQSALAAWDVRGATEVVDRSKVPAIDVRMLAAKPGDVSREAAQLEPRWACVMVAKRGEHAARDLDAAMTAVIGALHCWKPVSPDGRQWDVLRVAGVREVEVSDSGLAGYSVEFTTVSSFDGADD